MSVLNQVSRQTDLQVRRQCQVLKNRRQSPVRQTDLQVRRQCQVLPMSTGVKVQFVKQISKSDVNVKCCQCQQASKSSSSNRSPSQTSMSSVANVNRRQSPVRQTDLQVRRQCQVLPMSTGVKVQFVKQISKSDVNVKCCQCQQASKSSSSNRSPSQTSMSSVANVNRRQSPVRQTDLQVRRQCQVLQCQQASKSSSSNRSPSQTSMSNVDNVIRLRSSV